MTRPEHPGGEPLPSPVEVDASDPLEQRYRSLFDHHPLAVFSLDRDGRLTEVKRTAGAITGYSADQLAGMALLDLVTPETVPQAREAFAAVLDRHPQHLELTITRADGRRADVAVTGIPLVIDGAVAGVYGIAEDLTEKRRTARELDETRRIAAAASQARADFVMRMSHDFRTPLTSILAVIELLAETATTPEQAGLITTLERSGARLLNLVDGVLDFAHASSGDPETREEFDLLAVIRDAVDLIDKPARRKGLEVRLVLDPDLPDRIRDHPTWTSQILDNLLHNAVTHTDSGEISLTVSTQHDAAQRLAILYRITDTGTGIDPSDHVRIFEPFTQAAPATSRRGRAGLGLSIVKELVAISGGTITVTSTPGVGSTFMVLMPATPVGSPQ